MYSVASAGRASSEGKRLKTARRTQKETKKRLSTYMSTVCHERRNLSAAERGEALSASSSRMSATFLRTATRKRRQLITISAKAARFGPGASLLAPCMSIGSRSKACSESVGTTRPAGETSKSACTASRICVLPLYSVNITPTPRVAASSQPCCRYASSVAAVRACGGGVEAVVPCARGHVARSSTYARGP